MIDIRQPAYQDIAQDRHARVWRGYERVKPRLGTLRSLSWPAYLWANAYLSPFDYEADVLLDLGGGTGNFAALFHGRVRRIIVLDLVLDPLLAITDPDIVRVQGDILRLPLADQAVTKIIFSDVMEHFLPEHVPAVLAEISRILADQGTVFVNTSCYGFYLRRYFYRLLGRPEQGRLDWADLKDGHFNRFTHQEMLTLFQEAGLRVLDYRFLKQFFQPLPQIAKHFWGRRRGGPEREALAEEDNLGAATRSGRRGQQFWQAAVNLWSMLDPLLLGKMAGGAVFYKLQKA